MSRLTTKGFGAPDEFGAHIFRVEIPAAKNQPVRVVEDYGYRGGANGLPDKEDRAIVERVTWSVVSGAARQDFNSRLKAKNAACGRWAVGSNEVDRLLGKELCVLVWAAENAKPELLPTICSKWAALRPEERWWLFSMTCAEAGLPEDGQEGWRVALRAALSSKRKGQKAPQNRRPAEEPTNLLLTLETR